MNIGRRALPLLLCLCMVLNMVPMFAAADELVSDAQSEVYLGELAEASSGEINDGLTEVSASFDALAADYCYGYEGWVSVETRLAAMDVSDMIAFLESFSYAMDAMEALNDEDKAVVQAAYSDEIAYLTELAMAVNQKAAEPMPIASSKGWFNTGVTNDYYNIISEKHYGLVPGADEAEIILNNIDGTRRQVVHVFKVDGSKVDILPGYYGIDKDVTQKANQTDAKVTETAAYYEDVLGYDLVGGMNIALAYDCNAPYSFLIYEGKVLQDLNSTDPLMNQHSGKCSTYLAIYKDGSCELRSASEPYDGNEWHAVGANFGWLVKDGELVTKTVERTTSPASRSMLGILPDGSLIMCMADGRGANDSVGLSTYEMGEFMLALGCVNAVNGDGGGSSTFISRREGEANLTMRSAPSDGSERPTLHSVFLAKKKGMEPGIFDHVNIEAEYDYFVPSTTYTFGAVAIDTTGVEMAMPEGGVWSLADDSFGTIENGTFVSNGTLGEVTVQYTVNGTTAEKTVTVTNPVVAKFTVESTVLPYGKSTPLEMNVWADTVGEYPMYFQVDSFNWSLSDDAAATLDLDAMKLNGTTDESVSGVTVWAEYKHAQMEKLALVVAYGKGSEVIFDFEDGDVSDWMGFDEARQWSIENGVNNTLVGDNPLAGQFSSQVDGYTGLATAENGQVKNGKHALAWTVDNTDADFAGWTYNVLFNVADEPLVLRDVANGKNATALGMWLYIPEGATGLAFQSQLYVPYAGGGYSCKQDHFMFETVSGVRKNLNSCTEADIPQSRWVYATIDISKYDYICMPVSTDESNSRSPSFVRTYIKPTAPAVHTFYIDDITLDYSSAVDDREAPVIGEILYATADEAVKAEAAVIKANTMSFSATVSDYNKNNAVGLNEETAQIYVDGNVVDTVFSGGYMTAENVSLENGSHVVTFEIADNLGNYAQSSASFTVAASEEKGLVYVTAHNDSGKPAEVDSVYYLDIKTTDISQVDNVEVNVKLNSANMWELEHMIVAPGYTAEYEILSADLGYSLMAIAPDIHSTDNVAVVTITKTGDCTLTGEQTLVSMPIRLWSWNEESSGITAEKQFATGYCPIVTIDYDVLMGYVETTDGEVIPFGGSDSIATMINDTENPWHVHEVVALEDKPGTCQEAGYTGRTYCYGCTSVIEWGTDSAVTEHNYQIVGNKQVCINDGCGHEIFGTGLVEVAGKKYYMIAGNLQTGWQSFGADGYCYADPTTYEVYAGCEFVVDGLTYTANEEGLMLGGAWDVNFIGRRYSYGPKYYTRCFQTIDGEEYYFAEYTGYALTGYQAITENRNDPNAKVRWYHFAEDGKLIERMTMTGVLDTGNGLFYMEDGCVAFSGMVKVGDDYYCSSDKNGTVLTGKQYVGSYIMANSKNPLPNGYYEFAEDGKLLQGIVVKEDGTYYYEMGKPAEAGWVKDGDDYYVFGEGGKAMVGRNWVGSYLTQTSKDPYKSGSFIFDKNGKLANGIAEANDGWYYCEAGVGKAAGLLCIDGQYYYADNGGKLATGNIWVGTYPSNGLLPRGYYEFGTDGLMLEGIVEKEDGVYYYEQGKPVATGWLKVGDDYYVFGEGGKAVTGSNWIGSYLTETSRDPYKKGTFYFTEDGKLSAGIVEKADGNYYYEAGMPKEAGLINLDGSYYLAEAGGKLATGRVWVGTYASNNLLPRGYYEFGADGKMLQGVVEKADGLYYYDLGSTKYQGLIKRDGEYYYVNTDGKLEIGRVWVGSYPCNGLVAKGYYEFGADGAMLNGFETLEDGIYYYTMGNAKYIGLKIIGSDLYYIDEGGKVVTGTVWVGTYASNGLIPKGNYTFDAEGKFVK